MGLEKNNQQGTLTSRGDVNLGTIPFNLTVTDQIIAKSDPALLVDIISSEVGRIVDGLMDSLPTREQLLDYVFEQVSGDFTEVYQLPIENPYRGDGLLSDDNSSTSLSTVDAILKENFQDVLKQELHNMNNLYDGYIGIHPVSEGQVSQGPQTVPPKSAIEYAIWDDHYAHIKASQEFTKKNMEQMGAIFPDEWNGSPFVYLNDTLKPVPMKDQYEGVLNSPFGMVKVILDPSMPKNEIRCGTHGLKVLETFSKPFNDVHQKYQEIIQKLQYTQPVKFVVTSNNPLEKALAQKTAKILNNKNNHWWKKKGGKQ